MSATPAAPGAGSILVTRTRQKTRLAFVTIYIVWGVSFAVNRIMALALPPLLAAGSRFLLAACFLMGVAHWHGLKLPRSPRDWSFLTTAAVLGIVLSNGLSVLCMQHIASNQAALISSSAAFWIAWLGMYGRRGTPVSPRTWAGLIVGFAGVALLVCAHGFGARANVGWQLAMMVSALCWALASMVIRESHSECDPLAFTAGYLLVGGLILVGIGVVRGDTLSWQWSAAGVGAIVFLAIFSSTFGFVAYSYLLRHETPSRIGTYAYVNPIVAVLAGWLLLNETFDAMQIAGSLIVFLGVMMVGDLRLLPRGSAVPAPKS